MINKLTKIFKAIVIGEAVVLLAVCAVKLFVPQALNAALYKAHSMDHIQSYVITVTSIELQRADGSYKQIWKGEREIDISTVTSLGAITGFKGEIPHGQYKSFKLLCSKNVPKIKGTVSVGGVTYYTKTSHANFATGPAELEELKVVGTGDGGYAVVQSFNPPLIVGVDTPIAVMFVLIDISYGLVYWDGQGTGPVYGATAAGMYLPQPACAITFGSPAKKEVYEFTVDSFSDSSGKSRMTLLFNSADQLVGASNRSLKLESLPDGGLYNKFDMGLTGTYGATPNPDAFRKNTDGTYTVTLGDKLNSNNDSFCSYAEFTNFQRASHTGNYTWKEINSGEIHTGTYTCTKVE